MLCKLRNSIETDHPRKVAELEAQTELIRKNLEDQRKAELQRLIQEEELQAQRRRHEEARREQLEQKMRLA